MMHTEIGTIVKRASLAAQFEQHLKREPWLKPGLRLGVAVSGGADSVALLRLLLELRERLGIVVSVVHFNHKLRGKASDLDEAFVAKLAEKFGLSLHFSRADVAAKARRDKANLEDAGRRARYGFFQRLIDSEILDRVATAHTLDDQAETVLAHVLRGTGLAGLGGIHPQTPSAVRPLLFARRNNLRAYLRSKKQPWREDATNRDTARMRSRIRKKLLPLLAKQFAPEIAVHLATLAGNARADEALLASVTQQKFAAISTRDPGGIRIPAGPLLDLTNGASSQESEACIALARRIIRCAAEQVRERPGQWSSVHVDEVLDLAIRGENGKLLQLPGGVEVRRDRDTLLFSANQISRGNDLSHTANFHYSIDFSSPVRRFPVPELGCAFRFTVIDWPSTRRDTKLDRGTVLDRDRLLEPLLLRNWLPGDRMRLAGHRQAHKLKRLLNQKRIARWDRAGWPVLTSGGVLAWARGFPAAAQFAADDKTRFGVVIAEEGL
jgi:tRNA(Ile)-lysidine synthase